MKALEKSSPSRVQVFSITNITTTASGRPPNSLIHVLVMVCNEETGETCTIMRIMLTIAENKVDYKASLRPIRKVLNMLQRLRSLTNLPTGFSSCLGRVGRIVCWVRS